MGKRRLRIRRATASLGLFSAVLLISGGLRALEVTDSLVAYAQDTTLVSSDRATTELHSDNLPPGNPLIDIGELVVDIRRREEELDERERELRDQASLLKIMEDDIRLNLRAMQQAEESLRATLALSLEAAEKDLSRLTSVYENMKPKEAATLFEEMDPNFAAGFLSRMRPDAAAAVMAGLDPQTAYSISVIIAGRNANALTE